MAIRGFFEGAAFLGRWGALALLVLALMPAPAEARPTVSGTLVAYNPGARRLQIRRADGVIKNVVLAEGAKFEIYGNHVSPAQFRQGMQVAVRITGALNDDPLQADLLTDIGSSGRYVSTSATSPYSTPTGNYATGGGAGGVSPGLPQLGGPSVLGPLGMGGNFPGSLTNPMEPIPQNNSAYPQMIPGQGMPAQPSPLGSPYTGEVVAQQPGITPTAPAPNPYASTQGPSSMSAPGVNQAPGSVPYGAQASPYGVQPSPYGAQASPYGAQASPYGAPPSNASLIDGGSAQGPGATPSAMFGGHDDEEEGGGGGGFGSPTMGMQVLQFQGRIHSIDPYNRVITVVPAGAAYTMQVSLPAAVYVVQSGSNQAVPLENLRPGQGLAVHGLRNAAGIVEARAVQVTP